MTQVTTPRRPVNVQGTLHFTETNPRKTACSLWLHPTFRATDPARRVCAPCKDALDEETR